MNDKINIIKEKIINRIGKGYKVIVEMESETNFTALVRRKSDVWEYTGEFNGKQIKITKRKLFRIIDEINEEYTL